MINNFTSIIVDDEPQAIELLTDSLSVLNENISVIGTYSSWTNALHALRSTTCDILFLDISIQGKNGMDLLKYIPESQSEVIFISAYSNYGLDAIKHGASGYILKPIDDIELAAALDKTIKRVEAKRLAKTVSSAINMNNKIGIRNNKGIDYINTSEIIYLESINKCTKVVTTGDEIISSHYIGRFKELLNPGDFFQVHRSYIVNLSHIFRYASTGIAMMSNKKEIPVSRNVREDFLKLFATITKTSESGD